MKYIIRIEDGYYGYYCGFEYKTADKKYAETNSASVAKRFNTRAKAEHTMKRLIRTCVNATNAEIEEIEE